MLRLTLAPSALRAAVRDIAKTHQPSSTRPFSSLPLLRPSTSTPASVFARRPTTATSAQPRSGSGFLSAAAAAADLVPACAVSAHPALRQTQIRCGPRRVSNMNRPSRLIRSRRTGFLSRLKSKDGRKTIARRREKGRKRLGAA